MYIIAVKLRDGSNEEIANASAEYAFRVLSDITGKRLYSNENTWVMKIPDKIGDMDAVRQYYKYEPMYIRTDNDIPPTSDGVATFLKFAPKDMIGYGFITDVLDEHRIPFDLIKEKTI